MKHQVNLPRRIVLVGQGAMGCAVMEGLLAAPECQIVGVFCWSSTKAGKSYGNDTEEMRWKKQIQQEGLHQIECTSVNSFEFVRVLESLKPDWVLLATWGEIVKGHLLKMENIEWVNCHPSYLPAYRGADCVKYTGWRHDYLDGCKSVSCPQRGGSGWPGLAL